MKLTKVLKLKPLRRLLYWMVEREAIRQRKEAGLPKPWTDDPILQTWRFCNVRRMDDKVSRWLLDNWYTPFHNHRNMLVAAALARFINLPSSLEPITGYVFKLGQPDWLRIRNTLRKLKKQGETIFNGAYMVRGNDGADKVAAVINHYVKPLYVDPPELYRSDMQRTHASLEERYGFGSFMAGQVVADLRWGLDGGWFDKNFWAPIGPGSQRGMNRLMGRDVKAPLTQEQFEGKLTTLMEGAGKLPMNLANRLEAMDWQNCLCEFDKYSRVLLGEEGRPKQTYPGVA